MSLRTTCEQRRAELEQVLAHLGKDGAPSTRKDIEAALLSLSAMLTGGPGDLSPIVGGQLSRWLESSKHLGLKELREIAAKTRSS